MPVPLITANSRIFLSPEVDSDATTDALNTMRRGTPFDFVATATATTTLTSATAFSNANSWAYLGQIVEVLSGACQGNFRRITAFNAATDTVTVTPAFDAAGVATDPGTGAAFRLWIPPEPIMATDAGGSTTSLNLDTGTTAGRPGRDEGLGYWDAPTRYVAVGYGGANLNYAAQISAWDGAGIVTLVATVPALTSTVAGELWIPRLPVRPFTSEFGLPDRAQDFKTRRFTKGANDWDSETGITGARTGGNFTTTLEVARLSVTSATAPTAPSPPAEIHDLLASVTTYNADTGAMALASTGEVHTTILLHVTDTQRSRTEIGRAVLVNGEMRWTTATAAAGAAPDQISIAPPLTTAPATSVAGLIAYTGCNYSPRTTAFRSWTGEVYLGSGPGRVTFYGWLPGFRLEGLGAAGELARIVFTGPYDFDWNDTTSQPSYTTAAGGRVPTWTQVLPQQARAATFSLGVLGTLTPLTIRGFTFDPGLNPVKRDAVTGAHGNDGCFMAGLSEAGPSGTITLDMENMIHVERFQRGAVLEMMLQLGSAPGGTFGFYARRIQLTGAPIATGDGRYNMTIPYQVLASDLSGTNNAGTGSVTFPSWVMSFC